MNIKETIEEVHNNAKAKGFWDKPREVGTLLMLCVSELSEALEADRKDQYADMKGYLRNLRDVDATADDADKYLKMFFEDHLKDSFEDEIADTVIRLFDLCGAKGIDLEWHIERKMFYNSTREKKHGKAY